MHDEQLFSKGDLDGTLRNVRDQAIGDLNKLDPDYLLGASETDLVESLRQRYEVEPLILLREQISVDGPREADINVTRNPRYAHLSGEPMSVRGVAVTIIVPFQGDPLLFALRPSTFDWNPPSAKVVNQELQLVYHQVQPDAEAVKRAYEETLGRIDKYIHWGEARVKQHNEELEAAIRNAIIQRKQRLLADRNMVASLGLPLRRRDMPQTYAAPAIRRKPKIELPKAFTGPFRPEPALATEDYEFILKVIQDMTLVMERSPHAFAKMEEEHLRDHFLVQLNGHFEGAATAETFNASGKTDILIRCDNKNVFIAECKFWRGDKAFTATIDQLLGYTSWRDTKTAVLVFNRNRDTSKVLEKIPGLVKAHPAFKREVSCPAETQFRYILGHQDDANRELMFTVLIFDVPTEEAGGISDGRC